jgi:hypothetical protein
MNYAEAGRACQGQEYAFALPKRALARVAPDPNQPAVIGCHAPTETYIVPNSASTTKDGVTVALAHRAKFDALCIMGEQPQCASCPILARAKELAKKTSETFTKEEYKNLHSPAEK